MDAGRRTDFRSVREEPEKGLPWKVLFEDGTPVAEAMVAVFRETKILGSGRTDGEGRVVLLLPEDPAEVAVWRDTALLYRHRLDPAADSRIIRIPLGQLVSGTVLAGGSPPAGRVDISLSTGSGSTFPGPVPAFLAEILPGKPGDRIVLRGQCNPDGTFRFPGLSDDWHGRLTASYPGFRLETDPVELPHPASGIVLRFKKRPAILGRVVAPEDHRPVPGTTVRFQFSFAGGSEGGSVTNGSDGRFQIFLPGKALRETSLLLHAEGRGHEFLDLGPMDGTHDRDLGDILLKRVREIPFQVLDEGGNPVEKAVALGDWDTVWPLGSSLRFSGPHSSPTDSEGRGILEDAPVERTSMTVHALAYTPVTVALPPDRTFPVVVHLKGSSRLDVFLKTSRGGPAPGLAVVVFFRTESPRTASFLHHPDSIQFALGATPAASRHTDKDPADGLESLTLTLRAGKDGHVLLTQMPPSLPFDLEVRDGLFHALEKLSGLSLHEGERRRCWRAASPTRPGIPSRRRKSPSRGRRKSRGKSLDWGTIEPPTRIFKEDSAWKTFTENPGISWWKKKASPRKSSSICPCRPLALRPWRSFSMRAASCWWTSSTRRAAAFPWIPWKRTPAPFGSRWGNVSQTDVTNSTGFLQVKWS